MNMCRVCLHESMTDVVAISEMINSRTVAEIINFCAGIEVPSDFNFNFEKATFVVL